MEMLNNNVDQSTWDMTACGIGQLARGSSLRGSFRRSRREPHWILNIRQQLTDQLRSLDSRLETHLSMLWELQDFYRRRAEVEREYSKNLDKLVKNIMIRHTAEKQRRELWPGFSTYTCWQTLLSSTKRQSQDHGVLSDLYNNQMVTRYNDLVDDTQRVFRRVKDIAAKEHEELVKLLNELQSAMKTYHLYHSESKQAEGKLKYVESQKQKVEQHAGKGTLTKKFKNFEKQTEKRQAKYTEAKLKALKARNEYLLCLDAANAAIHKYYVEDLPDLIDCMDCGYHNTMAHALLTHISADECCIQSRQGCVDLLRGRLTDLDSRADKQQFLEIYSNHFSLPKKFDFQAHKGDEVCQISAQKPVQDELVDRLEQLNKRIRCLRVENDESWKTLETAEKSLMDMINVQDYDVSSKFQDENLPPKSPIEYQKKRSDRLETESFYIGKFTEYLLRNNLITRLEAKFNSLQKALGEGNVGTFQSPGKVKLNKRPPSLPPKPLKKRKLGKTPLVGQPKLFGGSIEEYLESTNQEIPLIVKSCIRVINMYGMHHQGVFRISGSHHEINEFKVAFERGEDPMVEVQDGKDINSVAGVLKLYFRELKEPLFPTLFFDQLMNCATENQQLCVKRVKDLVASFPKPIVVVMRYLFAFLNHLSEYSDENMMDICNLAICFGPTLLRIPPDKDQVQYQAAVNELVKAIIMYQEEIFPRDGGEMYEKCLVEDEVDKDDSLENLSDDEDDPTDAVSEDEADMVMEAVAQYDFQGRTDRELSFKKGSMLLVFNQVSNDWWEGALNGREGLIPDKYIKLRHRNKTDDEKTSVTDDDTRRSTESLPAKPFASSSSSSDDALDKSSSQPNIAVPPAPMTQLPSQPRTRVTSDLTTSMTSELMRSSTSSMTGSLRSLSSGELLDAEEDEAEGGKEGRGGGSPSPAERDVTGGKDGGDAGPSGGSGGGGHSGGGWMTPPRVSGLPPPTNKAQAGDAAATHSDDLQNIDDTLAEIMYSVQSLELQQQQPPPLSSSLKGPPPMPSVRKKRSPPPPSNLKHTPDLVLDLPVSEEPQSPKGVADKDSPTMSTAEVFAKSNQSTIKKGQSMPRGMVATPFAVSPAEPGDVLDSSSSSSNVSTFLQKRHADPAPANASGGLRSVTPTQPLFKAPTAPARTDRYSDPGHGRAANAGGGGAGGGDRPPLPTMVKSSTLPANIRPSVPDRPMTPERLLASHPRTASVDGKPGDGSSKANNGTPTAVPRPPLAASVSLPLSVPPERPKPPPKATKPLLMKKPAKSPEILRKLREEQEQRAQSGSPTVPPHD